MPRFAYTGIDPDGKTVQGKARAVTPGAARALLMERDLVPVSVVEKRSKLNVEITKRKVKVAELMQFSRQLAAFLRAGIPILDGIEILKEETSDKALRRILEDVTVALRQGDPLSAGLTVHAARFPSFYIEMLRAAEVTGALDEVLDQLAGYLDRDLEITRKIRGAMAYPIVIFAMSMVTVGVLSIFVLPRFVDFFESLNAKLPLPTRMLIAITEFFNAWWWLIAIAIVGLGIVLFGIVKTVRGRFAKDVLILKMPILGNVFRAIIIERICRMLASMIRAGVPLPRALELMADTTKNAAFERGLRAARAEMIEGAGLAGPLARTTLFPTAATQMLRVGEDTGTLEHQMELAAQFYDQELTYKIKKLTTLFEPAVIVIMGLLVGFVAIALISAMYGIFRQAGQFT